MAGVVIPFGYANLAYHFTGPIVGEQAVTTIGVQAAGWEPTTSDLEAVADAMAGTDRPLVYMGSAWKLAKVQVLVGHSGGATVYEKADGRQGTGAGSLLPPLLSWLVVKQTARAGRAGKGRMFLPGVNEGYADDQGVLNGTNVTAMQGYVNSFLADISTAIGGVTLTPVLLHTDPGMAPDPITALNVTSKLGLQRRRMGR